MDWNLICWFWMTLCANHNILKRNINNNNNDDDDDNNKKFFSKIDNIQKQTGLDERYDNKVIRIASNKQNINFNYTMNRNFIIKNLLYTLEDDSKNTIHKLEIIEKYKDVIYNKTEGINLFNGSLLDDWDFDFTL